MPTQIPTRTKQLGVRKLAATGEIDYAQYSVKSTLARVPESRIVLVPWRVFSADPESVCDSFRELSAEDNITYADDINVMMNVEGLQTPEFGKLDDFSQTWIVKTDEINLEAVIEHLKSSITVMGVTLTNRKLLGDHEEIPMVAFLDHKTPKVREAIMKLDTCRDILHQKPGTKFSIEVDIGDSVSRWAKEVLGQHMSCIGGRFCVTNGETYNHVFDWSNLCAFLPIICCCLVAIPIYKVKRKATYLENTFVVQGDACILGAASSKVSDQRYSLLTLMRRAQTDPKFERDSPDSGVHVGSPVPPVAPITKMPVPVAPAPESFTKKNDRTAVLRKEVKQKKLKPKNNVIMVDYKSDKEEKKDVEKKKETKEEDTPRMEPLPLTVEPQGLERQDSYMQADDLDTIARAFKMSKSQEPRMSLASPVTLSNFRADLLFCDIDDDSDDERQRGRRVSDGNFLDPNYDVETNQAFKKTPNPLTNIELMHFLTTKNKPAAIRNEEEQRRLEMSKKKRAKVGKGWNKVQSNMDARKFKDEDRV